MRLRLWRGLLRTAGMAIEEQPKHKQVASDLFASVRKKTGLSQKDLAEKVGICTRQWQYVESGDRQPAGWVLLNCLGLRRPELVREVVLASREGLPESKPLGQTPSSDGPGAGFRGSRS